MFWIFAGLLLTIAAAMLSFRLWRATDRGAEQSTDSDVDALSVLRDQKGEIDAEVAAGRMSAEERAARISELARRVHDEGLASPAPVQAPAPAKSRRTLAVGLTMLVPAIAIPVYLLVGTPAALDPAARAPAGVSSPHGEFTSEQIRAMLDQLKARLEARPDDVKGWTMLGRGSAVVGDFAGSAAAFERAVALKPDDAALLADYADSWAMSHNQDLSGKAWVLIQQALRADPALPKALALAAAAEFAQGRLESAKGYWRRQLAVIPADSENAIEIRAVLSQLEQRAAGGVVQGSAAGAQSAVNATSPTMPAPGTAKGASSPSAVMPADAAAAGKTAAPKDGTPAPQAAAAATPGSGKPITGIVRIAPSLAAQVAPGDTLFIFARAEGGPRMPLAIVRAMASELPRQFRLDDSQAMAGGPTLSSTARVRIEARISRSGEALPRSGDLRGESAVVAPGTQNVEVVIDRSVP